MGFRVMKIKTNIERIRSFFAMSDVNLYHFPCIENCMARPSKCLLTRVASEIAHSLNFPKEVKSSERHLRNDPSSLEVDAILWQDVVIRELASRYTQRLDDRVPEPVNDSLRLNRSIHIQCIEV